MQVARDFFIRLPLNLVAQAGREFAQTKEADEENHQGIERV
jgi:hypothetical protein